MILLVETVAPHAAIIAERLRANVAALPENQASSWTRCSTTPTRLS